MKRTALLDLDVWYQGKKRKPLILRGARQVGKSTLVRLFAESRKLKLIEINFEKTKLKKIDTDQIDLEQIILEIELKSQQPITKNTLIFFDEIQESAKAIQILRYFYEERPDIAIIAAGSLLEFVLNDHRFSMPVGRVEYYHLGPVTFGEYLTAIGKEDWVKKLALDPFQTAETLYSSLSIHLREYFYIGGMPEAIQTFLDQRSYLAVKKIHQSIMDTYLDDFQKYATKSQSIHLGNLIRTLPRFLGKKIKLAELLPETKHSAIKNALQLLEQAKIIRRCVHTNATGIPLYSIADESVFKLYFLDIGLLNHLLGISADDIINEQGEKAVTEGIQAEQFVAQHLTEPLFYWLKNKKKEQAEIDFIIQKSKRIIPIEVKSGKSGTLKSLHHFMCNHQLTFAVRFDLKDRKKSAATEQMNCAIFDGKNTIQYQYQLNNFPLFAVEWLMNHL
jgi:predicted AAA+ superfamily ATPase